jgi:hypothetical protein
LVGNRGGAQAQYGVVKEQKKKRPWQAAVGAKEKGRDYSRPLWAQMVIGVWLVILYSFLHLPHFATMQEGDSLTKRRRLHFWHRYWFTLITSFIILASADIPEGMFRRGPPRLIRARLSIHWRVSLF